MSDIRCTCGHLVGDHTDAGCLHRCNCDLREVKAYRAAQRKAAIEHLKQLGSLYNRYRLSGFGRGMEQRAMARIYDVYSAYRAVGILGRKDGER